MYNTDLWIRVAGVIRDDCICRPVQEQCTTHQTPFVAMIAEPMHGIGCHLNPVTGI